jgi:hypothetical protein
MFVCPSRRVPTAANSADIGGAVATIIDYAAAQPCTVQCHVGAIGCPPIPQYYTPSQTFTPAIYTTNLTSFWGGRFQQKTPGPAANSVYDGVIVRTAWDRTTKSAVPGVSTPVKISKIADGTSKTLLVGEKYLRPDLYEGLISYSDDQGWSDGWDLDMMRCTCFAPMSDGDNFGYSFQNTTNDYFGAKNDVVQFGAAHTSGFNAVFVDGSIHTISYDIDVVIFNGLGTRAGGESGGTPGVD